MTTAPGRVALPQARRVTRRTGQDEIRQVRVVHDLDGIEHPVEPHQLTAAGEALWRRWRTHPAYEPPTIVLGLDAGGIIPAVAVALASTTPYRLAWKLDLDLPQQHVFHEPHARRPQVCVYGPLAGERVLIVDDEVTTGKTVTNLIDVLRDAGAAVTGVVCLAEDTSGDGRRHLARREIPLCALTRL